MDTQLARGIMHAGNPLTYLREKLATTTVTIPAPVAAVPADTTAFVCQHCADKPAFKSQKALNGHMKKHSLIG